MNTDLILGNEVSEFQVNRQLAKIQFLQQENQQLQESIKDLSKALVLNKDILKITFETQAINNSSDTNSSMDTVNKSIIRKLIEENLQTAEQLKKMTEERNISQDRLLLQQQISEENLSFYKDMIQDLEDKVQELRRCIYDKEYAIQEIEKSKIIIDQEGQMIKIREVDKFQLYIYIISNLVLYLIIFYLFIYSILIYLQKLYNIINIKYNQIVTPNEQTLRLYEELESTRQILNKISAESQNLAQQNIEYKETNFNFKRELIKMRIVLRNPVSYYKMKDFIYDDYYGNTDDNLELQNCIYTNPGQDNNYNGIEQQEVQQDIGIKQFGIQPQKSYNKYLSGNERQSFQDKLVKSDFLLQGFKDLFEKEKNKNSLLGTRFNEIQRLYLNLEEINTIVVKAIKSKQMRIQKLINELAYYKQQYAEYILLLKNKRRVNRSFQRETQVNVKIQKPLKAQPVETAQIPDAAPEEDVKVNVSILEENKFSNNGSMVQKDQQEGDEEYYHEEYLDHYESRQVYPMKNNNKNKLYTENDFDRSPSPQKNTNKENRQNQVQSQYQMTKKECKEFLINSAREIYLIYNLRMNNLQRKKLLGQVIKPWQSTLPIWHQKSSSDPLDYFTLNLQDLELKTFEPKKPLQEKKNDILKQQIERKLKKQKNKNHPFYLDVSLIHKGNNQPKEHKQRARIDAELSFISNDNVLDGIKE